jgi:hypothetical protein
MVEVLLGIQESAKTQIQKYDCSFHLVPLGRFDIVIFGTTLQTSIEIISEE